MESFNRFDLIIKFFVLDEWSSYTTERYTGISHWAVQVSGLLIKRFHRTKRNMKGLIAEILLPILFVLLAMLVTKLAPNQEQPPPLILHPWYWGKPNYIFQSLPVNRTKQLSRNIQRTFDKSPSFGTRCMASTMLDKQLYPCAPEKKGLVHVETSPEVLDALDRVNYNLTRISPACDCYQKMQTCPVGAGGPTPNFFVTDTQDLRYYLRTFNITDWFVYLQYSENYH